MLRCGLAAAMMLATTALADEEKKGEKIDFTKLIGKWEPAEKKDQVVLVIEFAAKDKVSVSVTALGKTDTIEGTYKTQGNRLDIILKIGDQEQKESLRVSRLTDEEFVAEDSKGKTETLKRKKAR